MSESKPEASKTVSSSSLPITEEVKPDPKVKERKRKFTWTPARRESFQKCIDANKKMRSLKEHKQVSKTAEDKIPTKVSKEKPERKPCLKSESETEEENSSTDSDDSSTSFESIPIKKKKITKTKKHQIVASKDIKKVLHSLTSINSKLKKKRKLESLKKQKVNSSEDEDSSSQDSDEENTKKPNTQPILNHRQPHHGNYSSNYHFI